MRSLKFPSPSGFFGIVATVGGLVLVFLTPPFQVPDEPSQFFRAFAISEGKLVADNTTFGTGSMVPTSLNRLVKLLVGDIPFHPDRAFNPAILSRARRIELLPEDRTFRNYPTTASYSPVPYLPQAVGILVGRSLGAPPLSLVYLGRVANLAFAVVIICLALVQLPTLRWFACVLALSPMAMFLRSSLSADSVTFALAMLVSATIAKVSFSRLDVSKLDAWILLGCTPLLCLTKPPYAALAITLAVIPANQLRPAFRRRLKALAVVGCLLATVVGIVFALHVEAPLRPGVGVDACEQVAFASSNPFFVARIVVADYLANSPRYMAEVVGCLGWLDTPLPKPFVVSYLIILVGLFLGDASWEVRLSVQQRLVVSLSVVATMLLVSLSQYAVWTPVGASFIEGTQGRHYYPAMAFAIWACFTSQFSGSRERVVATVAKLVVAVSFCVTVVALLVRYYCL